jgi:crotonobetainyl-CoA:carnitine CoA-transferase CaiB-like acyl-CoA transferase
MHVQIGPDVVNSVEKSRQNGPPMTSKPLSGIRVVEMSHMIMGPSCGMFLALMGADVIKIEPPGGDRTRQLTGMGAGFFPLFNRGKRSITLDLTSEGGRAAFHRLLDTADGFIENFREGALAERGLGTELLREKHPRLIVVSHKGFLSGPYQNRTAMDEVVQPRLHDRAERAALARGVFGQRHHGRPVRRLRDPGGVARSRPHR